MKTSTLNRPFRTYFRKRRMAQFCALFDITDQDLIIDVGGLEFNWAFIPQHPHILFVNTDPDTWVKGNTCKVVGDGRRLEFADQSFDIAYSNSVIEHVGGWEDIQAFAREIRRVAPRYYVQTPNRWFFVETHLLTAFIHWLPFNIARHLVRYGSVWGWIRRPSQQQVDEQLRQVNLLTHAQMRTLFPDATIHIERFLGMPKSLIAVRNGRKEVARQAVAEAGPSHPMETLETDPIWRALQ